VPWLDNGTSRHALCKPVEERSDEIFVEVEARRHLDEHDRELLAQHVHLGREGVELRVNVDQPPLVRDRLRQLHGEAEARSHAPGPPPPRRATMGAVKRRVTSAAVSRAPYRARFPPGTCGSKWSFAAPIAQVAQPT